MITLISALGIIIIFFSLGAFLRYGDEAKNINSTEKDKKSTSYLGRVYVLNFIVLLSAFFLNHLKISILFNNPLVAFWGNLIMLIGLLIRVYATWSLKEYYTRTLKIQTNQKIVDFGLYRYLRHPGYLGSIMIWIGAGLSSNNYIVMLIVSLLTLIVYYYRIQSEEKMLIDAFGEEYKNYKIKTWRLIPLIY
jgi:protein-S-isoprenylcysteine O-methyltransferase Ste14